MWIDSGKNPADPEVDTPSDRNTEVVLPGRHHSLFHVMSVGLFDHFPRYMGMRRDGTQGPIPGGEPRFQSSDLTEVMLDLKLAREHLQKPSDPVADVFYAVTTALETFGCRWAMYWFAKLLDSPFSHHISRCDRCKTYFAYQRARLRTVKFGVRCPKCASNGSVERTKRSRKNRLDTAAKAWVVWDSKHKSQPKREWVADQVNKSHGTAIGRRWVSQNLTEIQERVEALRNAKRQS
jgi:hypothetical protein